jgi:DNA-binding NarL/FixJ family response regulator
MNQIKIMLVDDHQIIRDGLKKYLLNDNNFVLVGEGANGNEALEILKTTEVDIVLSDLNMPEMDGLELTENIIKSFPNTKVIILTMLDEPHYIKQLMGSGAEGYLFKNSGVDEVKKAIKRVYDGDTYLSQEVTNSLTQYVIKRKQNNPKNKRFALEANLSSRELEVLELIIKERTNQEIADKLFISVRTVDAHKRNMIEKTGSRNIAGLVMYAITHQLLDT